MPRLGTDAHHRAKWMRHFQTTGGGSDRPRSWRPRLTSQRQDQSGWRTCAIASRRLVSLHEPFQGCVVYTQGLCATVCVNTTFAPVDPACARFCCHAIMLNVYGGHVPIWGGVWENGKLYFSQMNFDLVWIIQMVGLWCTAVWASATKMHAFDRDVRLAVGVWWYGVASQPMAGHPWSLLTAIWIHSATWRRLLDRTCCPSSVVREGTWPFSRTMLDHRLRVSSWIFSVMRMCWWWLGPRMSPDLSPIEHVWDEMDRRLRQRPNQTVTLQGLGEALQEAWQEIPQASNANLVASMSHRYQECVNARGGHTHNSQCEL